MDWYYDTNVNGWKYRIYLDLLMYNGNVGLLRYYKFNFGCCECLVWNFLRSLFIILGNEITQINLKGNLEYENIIITKYNKIKE